MANNVNGRLLSDNLDRIKKIVACLHSVRAQQLFELLPWKWRDMRLAQAPVWPQRPSGVSAEGLRQTGVSSH